MSITPLPNADFAPTMAGYSGQKPFRFWCQTVLPLVYDDSLSYYELLNKVVNYLNNTIEDVASVEDNVDGLLTAYIQLQDYVNDYFSELDVQEEIDLKLDEMASSGALNVLIDPVVAESTATWLTENVDPVGSAVVVNPSLTVSGAAADAKVVGDNFNAVKSVNKLNEQAVSFNKNTNVMVSDIWSKNGIRPADGVNTDNGYNFRTDPFIYADKINCVKVSNNGSNTYLVYMFQYDKDYNYIQNNHWTMNAGITRYFTTINANMRYIRFMIATSDYAILTNEQVSDIMANITVDILNYKTGSSGIIVNRESPNSPVVDISYSNGEYTATIDFPADRYSRLFAGNKIVNLAGRSLDISSVISYFATIWYDINTDDFVILDGAASQTSITPYCYYIATIYGPNGISINTANGFTINGVLRHGTGVELLSFRNKKKLSFLGDSITSFNGYSESSTDEVTIDGNTYTYWGAYYPNDDVSVVSDTYWWKMWHSIVPSTAPVVSGVSRSRFRNNIFPASGKCAPAFWNDSRLNRICSNSPNIIFINGGTNDCFGWRDADGVLPNTKNIAELEEMSETTARGVYLTLSKLISMAPNAIIIGIIPKYLESSDITFDVYGKMCRTLKSCYENYGIPIIDLSQCGISANNVNGYTVDKIHPNKNGMNSIFNYIRKHFPI